jgi:ABC-2 type transport system ATP-binding protein
VLDTLVDTGTSLLLTTQYLDEAERLADDILVVDHGRIIAQGNARTLKREVGGDHVHVVVVDPAQVPDAARIVARTTGTEPRVDPAVRAVTAPTTQGLHGLVTVASALSEAGVAVDDLSLRQPTLDEVFLTLTGARPSADRSEETTNA